mgnify:CR=1 FL=1
MWSPRKRGNISSFSSGYWTVNGFLNRFSRRDAEALAQLLEHHGPSAVGPMNVAEAASRRRRCRASAAAGVHPTRPRQRDALLGLVLAPYDRLYDVSHGSSLSKNSTWAMPSLA